MKWEDYVNEVLAEDNSLDNISLKLDGVDSQIPQIVKASVYLLDKMIANQGKYNVIVFPDGEYAPFFFALAKVIYNIASGKIQSNYDLHKFVPGQKIRLGSCIAEFVKVGFDPQIGEEAIVLRFSDATLFCKKEYVPYLQTIETKKKISPYARFVQEKKKIEIEQMGQSEVLKTLSDMKTHMSESIVYISSVTNSSDISRRIEVEGKDLFDYFFISQTDYMGKVETLKGLYSGTPALILSSTLAYANEAIMDGAKVQSAIINLIDNDINTQLADLDELIQYKFPIVCVTDTVNSFDIEELKNRGFNIWRWDRDSITSSMCEKSDGHFSKKNTRCKNSNVTYHEIAAPLISDSFSLLFKLKNRIEEESSAINNIFNTSFEIASFLLRDVCDISKLERNTFEIKMKACKEALEKERDFISEDIYKAFGEVIENFNILICRDEMIEKAYELEKIFQKDHPSRVCIVCANSEDPNRVYDYWKNRFSASGYAPILKVLQVKEFLKTDIANDCPVFLAGWFGSRTIRQIVYGYGASRIHILLYDCEKRWKNAHSRVWKSKLSSSNNSEIVSKSFSPRSTDKNIEFVSRNEEKIGKITESVLQEQDDVDIIIQENKYRQYISRGNSQGGTDVEAKPISFIGGEIALFTRGHKSLVTTNIIHQKSNRIEEKETDELKVGDFIAIRETSKDIIREVADKILLASGKEGIRERVAIWKEALRIESMFSSIDEIYEKLKEQGCTRNITTVKNWVYSESIIIPQSKEDLIAIARASSDEVLIEKVDTVYDEGSLIKRAHIKAGNILSERLTNSVAKTLASENKFDPYNVWDPIELVIDDVGPVNIYKIIDISQSWITTNSINTNKIMNDDSEE